MNTKEQKFEVNGMTCGHCVMTVTNALKSVAGVQEVDVSLDEKNAVVVYDADHTNPEQLSASLKETNYSAQPA